MSTDRKQTSAELRRTQRAAMEPKMREVAALEQIADALEEIRATLVGMAHLQARINP